MPSIVNRRKQSLTLSILLVARCAVLGVQISTFVLRPSTRTTRRDVFLSNSHVGRVHPMKRVEKQRQNRQIVSGSSTSLSSSLSNHIAAGGTLLLSSLVGIIFDNFFTKKSGGHVVSLLSAAVLSNLSKAIRQLPSVPTEHVFYDWCWSVFLPASLVFALLSSSSTNKLDDGTTESKQAAAMTMTCIQGMAIPFLVGSVGSILGCALSFLLVPMSPTLAPAAAEQTITSAILAGCLCASYIGGTVNFFAAGKILTPLSNSNDMGNVFGSMAAADLVVMALYFTMLSAASKSPWLQQLFPIRSQCKNETHEQHFLVRRADIDSQVAANDLKVSIADNIGAVSMTISMALSSVFFASHLEKAVINQLSVPGTMCAFLAMFGLIYDKLIEVGSNALQRMKGNPFMPKMCTFLQRSLKQIHVITPRLGNLSFFLLFAAVGTTADVSSAVMGGPLALIFATLALMIHSTVLLAGTFFGSTVIKFLQKIECRWPQPTWQEVLTASNSAIGGPSTSAAFAAGLDEGSCRRALVISATVYGVFGYAIGTSIGVVLTKSLLYWIR